MRRGIASAGIWRAALVDALDIVIVDPSHQVTASDARRLAARSRERGAVIVDLAAGSGGNTPLSQPDRIVEVHGVTIMGPTNLPGALAVDASSLYARNLFNFISLIVDKKTGALNIDWNDEIIKGSAVTKDGQMVTRG